MTIWTALTGGVMLMAAANTNTVHAERQITNDLTTNHKLDFNRNFSPDGKWLVYDTRIDEMTTTQTIEKIHVETGEIVVVYRAKSDDRASGTGIGAVSWFPATDEVVFIHGYDNGLPYGFTRRTGAIVPADGSAVGDPSQCRWADARDITPPFTPGALRGGTHRHDPGGPDGRWIGYTYNDAIMAAHGHDLRSLGVTKLGMPVTVNAESAGENRSGEGFSVVIVKVCSPEELDANIGSDRIYRATDDQWIGTRGYRKPDGAWQLSRAFIGHMRVAGEDGVPRDHYEVFVVEIPEDIIIPGLDGPLEGTESQYPAPPLGTVQRRLTYTERGCRGLIRSTDDGSLLAFISAGSNRKPQVFVMSPHSEAERTLLSDEEREAGALRQVTSFPEGVREPPSWLPDGIHFVTVTGGKIVVINSKTRAVRTLTADHESRPHSLAVSPDGRTVAFNRDLGELRRSQIFVADIELSD